MKTLLTRFNEKYTRNPVTGCWDWRGGKDTKRLYGRLRMGLKDGRTLNAHRIAYMLFNGDVPSNLFVCHTCDNPGCVNPDHLFLGTAQDNMTDKCKKGRHKTCPPGKHWVNNTSPIRNSDGTFAKQKSMD